MSNIDELLINSQLEERKPKSLPWNGKDEGGSKVDCTKNADEPDLRLYRYNRNVNDHNLLHKTAIEEPREHSEKYNITRIDRCDNETNILFCNTDITFAVKKTATPEQEDIDRFGNQSLGYKPSFCEDRLSNNNKRPIPFRYNYVERKQNGNHFASFSATCTKVDKIQNKLRKSPRSTVKVSRQMIQESKLGYPLPTPSDKPKLENKDRTSRISNSLLNRENKDEHKLENHVDTKIRTTRTKDKKMDRALAGKNQQFETNEKHLANKEYTMSHNKTVDINVGTQLDELLNVTEETMQSPNTDHKTHTGDGTKVRNDKHGQKNASTMTNNSMNRTLNAMKFPNSEHKTQTGDGTKARNDKHGQKKASTMTKHTQNYRYNENFTKSIYKYMPLESKAGKDPNYEEKKYNVAYREMYEPKYYNEKDKKFDEPDEDRYDEYSEDLNKNNQKKDNRETGEDKDEILKFTCQMMEIKQPKLMSQKNKFQKTNVNDKLESGRGRDNYEKNFDTIDMKKVEELNKKSEEMFWKIIRDRNKKREKKTVVINLDPDCVRKKIQKREKIRTQTQIKGDTTDVRHDTPSIIFEIEDKKEDADDVFDISPAKNKETLTDDSESESSYLPKHNNNTDVDSSSKPHESAKLQTTKKDKVSKSYTIVSHDLKPKTTGKDTLVKSKSSLKTAKRKKIIKEGRMRKDGKLSENVRVQDPHIIDRRSVDQINDDRLKEQIILRQNDRIEIEKESLQMPENVSNYDENTQSNKFDGQLHFVGEGTPKMEWDDIMYDSDTDSNVDSSICSSEQGYISRPSTATSRELEFPRPASNKTFILHSNDSNSENISTTNDLDIGINDGDEMKEQKKLGKLQRFLRLLTCCVRPKTEN